MVERLDGARLQVASVIRSVSSSPAAGGLLSGACPVDS